MLRVLPFDGLKARPWLKSMGRTAGRGERPCAHACAQLCVHPFVPGHALHALPRTRAGEYIDDTEDLINIELDYSRNRLIRLEILITIGTFSLAFFNIVTGMLGENLVIPPSITQDIWGFVLVNLGTGCFCVSLFVGAYWLLRMQKVI